MSVHSFDIETIPNETMVDYLPEVEIKILKKDTDADIEKKREDARKKQFADMGLNPLYGRICSVSFFGEQYKDFTVIHDLSDASEISLITRSLELITEFQDNTNGTAIVTHNGMGFDFPYLFKRAALLRVELPSLCQPLSFWRKRYTHKPHCDLMMEMGDWKIDHKGNNLNNLGKIFLGNGKTTRDYSTYLDLIKAGEGEKIGLDNLCDTELTFDLYNRLAPYLF